MKNSWHHGLALSCATFVVCVQAFVKIDLNGDGWTVTENKTNLQAPGKVPGSMYTALIDNGTIGDPLFRDNDVKYAWIGDTDWTYSRNFTVPNDIANSNHILLISEGLDTIATVLVNDQVVGHSENMFVWSVFDVKRVIKSGENSIVVQFKSAVTEALARTANSDYVVPPECPATVQNGKCHINQIRKEQCSFSWDWGPSFPTQGIWKPIFLAAYNTAVIGDASALVKRVNSLWEVDVQVYFHVGKGDVTGQLQAGIAGLNFSYSQDVSVSAANDSIHFTLQIPATTHVPLWWPNGYGDQPLFDLNISFTAGADTTSRSVKIGFRTVELVQEPVSNKSEQGLTFYFRINGLPVFLKGSNWIPADSFQERITKDSLRFLLQSAADVGINSLRVWGGGVYESEDFYNLCDELGIMIWQDMMFSVNLYPTYPAFLSLVSTEISQQLWRLKSHTSIIIWAGNNENESALKQNWFHIARNDYDRFYNDYIKLYVQTIKPIVEQEDSTRAYVTSSPSNGKKTEQEGYVASDTSSELYGDIHFYDYSVDQWKDSSFRIPRMATEYGIQAWCNSESLTKVFEPFDFGMETTMVNHRQHHGNGNKEMSDEVSIHLNLPNSPDTASDFKDFIYLTQINQAMSIRTQSEHYRRHQSRLRPDGRGLTMGALYWQLNDIWQAPTWASIDYEGSWKVLHYYAKTFFNRFLVSPYLLNDDTLDVFLLLDGIPVTEVRNPADGSLSFQLTVDSNDLVKAGLSPDEATQKLRAVNEARSGNLKIEIYDYSSFDSLHSWTVTYNVSTPTESVFTKKISDLLSDSGCPTIEDCLLYFTAIDQSGALKSTTWYPLAYPKFSKLKPAHVKITSVTQADPYTFNIEVSTDAIALFVWLSVDNVKGVFSDNGFLLKTPQAQVQFFARELVSLENLSSQLKVKSVADVKSNTNIIG